MYVGDSKQCIKIKIYGIANLKKNARNRKADRRSSALTAKEEEGIQGFRDFGFTGKRPQREELIDGNDNHDGSYKLLAKQKHLLKISFLLLLFRLFLNYYLIFALPW